MLLLGPEGRAADAEGKGPLFFFFGAEVVVAALYILLSSRFFPVFFCVRPPASSSPPPYDRRVVAASLSSRLSAAMRTQLSGTSLDSAPFGRFTPMSDGEEGGELGIAGGW